MILKCFLALTLVSCVFAFSPRGLLGTTECTSGPAFWCHNITNAKKCHAVKHCIESAWEHQTVPEDDDSICNECKRMVVEARNVLESNETVEEMKEVFEGTCRLIRLKPVVKACSELADEYVPELVDMISSQMNPTVICSVAGLCNNAAIDKMLEEADKKKVRDEERTKELQKDCEPCLDFADIIGNRIEKSTEEDVKSYLADRCRSLGSLSESCANIVDEYSGDFYKKLKDDFTPSSLCYLTSSCVNGYARKIQVKTESDVGVIHVNNDAVSVAVKHLSEDETCDLCKQLVKHLQDILVANTTEREFKEVLKGLCKQTGRFKGECMTIADEYYDKIYETLVNDLDGRKVCAFAGICPRAAGAVFVNGASAPLLPSAPVPMAPHAGHVSVAKPDSGVRVFAPFAQSPMQVQISFGDPLESRFQLPIERMVPIPHADLGVNNRGACMFCQYFLHYVQKVITQPYGVKMLEDAVNKACDELPKTVNVQCRDFVQKYGDLFVALLAQEIDPSQVCPSLRVCPAKVLKDKYEPLELGGKPGCPLCLMAIEELTEKLKDNKTEASIRHALHSICTKMPKNLKPQCDDFVDSYTEEVIDMMLADFTPEEVCTYLKICRPKQADAVELVLTTTQRPDERIEILTNEIPFEDHRSAIAKRSHNPPACVLCEFIMDKVTPKIRSNATEKEMKRVLLGTCRRMPKTVRSDCNDFLQRYSFVIVEMLTELVPPGMVCSNMHVCKEDNTTAVAATVSSAALLKYQSEIRNAVEECAMCEAFVGAIRALLEDPSFDMKVARYVSRICSVFPPSNYEKCSSMLTSYGPTIINLLVEYEMRPSLVCSKIELCDSTEQAKVELIETTTRGGGNNSSSSNATTAAEPKQRHLLGGNRCTWGPSYWCQSEDHANSCGTLAHCREMVWKAQKPPTTPAA